QLLAVKNACRLKVRPQALQNFFRISGIPFQDFPAAGSERLASRGITFSTIFVRNKSHKDNAYKYTNNAGHCENSVHFDNLHEKILGQNPIV
ncbi:MAG: hypothetical protein ACI4O8_09975, partial [Aristaeellaceae bacterium]